MSKKMSTQELERRLGQQYAQVLRDTRHTGVYQDCEEVIHTSLGIMEYYNRISMALHNRKARRQMA